MGAGCACLSQALSEVISVPFRLERRGLVLHFPLAVSAAMGVFCVCEPDRAAVVDREPLPCDCSVVGGRWLALAKCHRITPPALGLPPWASPRLAHGSRPHAYRQAREATRIEKNYGRLARGNSDLSPTCHKQAKTALVLVF